MAALGAEIRKVPGDYEAAVDAARRFAAENDCYDANPGGDNTVLQLQAYGEIAYEIYDELRDAPAAIAAPVSNGTTLAGLYRGFLSLYRRGKTSHMPRIVAGSAYRKNPIVQSFLLGHRTCLDLSPAKIHETTVNEPLINWHAIDGDHAFAGDPRNQRLGGQRFGQGPAAVFPPDQRQGGAPGAAGFHRRSYRADGAPPQGKSAGGSVCHFAYGEEILNEKPDPATRWKCRCLLPGRIQHHQRQDGPWPGPFQPCATMSWV